MELGRQFIIFLENKPGRLSNIVSALAREKINIQALTVMDSKEHSILRFVADNPQETRSVLARTGAPFSEAEVILVELKNQPGAVARLCERLAGSHINIDYMYCSAGAKNGRTLAVLKATPVDKVKQILQTPVAPKNPRMPVRRVPVRR